MKYYLIYKNHGLYDPVVDDQDQAIEPDHSDRPSRLQHTEVLPVQQFIEPVELSVTSLIQPYNSFPTEPSIVASLENPIVLETNYKDMFGRCSKEFAETKFKLPISKQYDCEVNRKCKSEEKDFVFDVYKNLKDNTLIDETVKRDLDLEERIAKEVILKAQLKRILLREELNFKEVIDENNVEKTAMDIVDQSIERAILVAEEIKKEINEELRIAVEEGSDYATKFNEDAIITGFKNVESQLLEESVMIKSTSNALQSEPKSVILETKSKENDSNIEVKAAIRVERFEENNDRKQAGKERKLCTNEEIDEVIEAGSVKRKSIRFDKQTNCTKEVEKKHLVDKTIEKSESAVKGKVEIKKQAIQQASSFQKSEGTSNNGKVAKFLQAEQKAFDIGVQTIPNIRESLQSSCHFELLLRTFFVHLKDVMVVLSRIISPRSVFSGKPVQSGRIEETCVLNNEVNEDKIKKDESQIKQCINFDQNDTEEIQLMTKEIEIKPIESSMQQENEKTEIKSTTKEIKHNIFEEVVEKRKLSGAKMAQFSEKKNEMLTQQMDAVISEFETKAIEGDTKTREDIIRRIRSRSRSKIEEEVMQASDPLEWLAKVDSMTVSQERNDVVSSKKEFSSYSESRESKNIKSLQEPKQTNTYISKPGKQMYEAIVSYNTKPSRQTYVAIVESHVYTNENFILENQIAEISKTSSVQSSEQAAFKAVTLDRVVIDCSIDNDAIISHKSQEHPVTNSESEATVHFTKSIEEDTNEIVQDEIKQQAAEVITKALQEFVVQEKHEVMEPILEFKTSSIQKQIHLASVKAEPLTIAVTESTEATTDASKHELFQEIQEKTKQALTGVEENFKTTAVQVCQLNLEMTSETDLELKDCKEQASSKNETLAVAIAGSTETSDDISKVETFEPQHINRKTALVSAVENYKTTAVQAAQLNLEMATEDTSEFKVNQVQASVNQKSLAVAVAASTETSFEVPKVDIFVLQKIASRTASMSTENDYKTTAVQAAQQNLERAEENIAEFKVSQTQASVKQESMALAVAASTDTSVDVLNVVLFETPEIKPKTAFVSEEENHKTSAVQVTQLDLETAESSASEYKVQVIQPTVKQECLAMSVAASTETSADVPKIDIFGPQEIKPQTAIVSTEDNYKATAVQATQLNLEIAEENKAEFKTNQVQALVKQESLAIAVAATIDTSVEALKVDIFEPHEIKTKTAIVSAEENYKKTAVQAAQFNLEMAEQKNMEIKAKSAQASVKQETQDIAVATSIETSVEVSKVESQKMISEKSITKDDKTFVVKIHQQKLEKSENAENFIEVDSTETNAVFKLQARKSHKVPIIEDNITRSVEITELDAETAFDEFAELNITNENDVILEYDVTDVADAREVNKNTSKHVTIQEISDNSVEEGYNQVRDIRKGKGATDEFASLKLTKKQVLDIDQSLEIAESTITRSEESQQMSRTINQEISSSRKIDESKLSSKSLRSVEKLCVRTDIAQQRVIETQASVQSDENNNTPSPSTVPPTPLTDEYIFKLEAPLPSREGTPVPRDCTPDDEDPHILKKKIIPHVEISIEQILYDPPLPSPPEDKAIPIYTKPGLKGGAGTCRKVELRNLEKKSFLLTSAIDKIIKSIEEYKEEVGIFRSKDIETQEITKFVPTMNGTDKEKSFLENVSIIEDKSHMTNGDDIIESKKEQEVYILEMKEEWKKIDEQVEHNIENLGSLSDNKNGIDIQPKEKMDRYQEKVVESSEEVKYIPKDMQIEINNVMEPEPIENISETPNISVDIITEITGRKTIDIGIQYSEIHTQVQESKSTCNEPMPFEVSTKGRELEITGLETNLADTDTQLAKLEINFDEFKAKQVESKLSTPEINFAEFKSEIIESQIPAAELSFGEIKTELVESELFEPEIKSVEIETDMAARDVTETVEESGIGDALLSFNSGQLSHEALQDTIVEQNVVNIQEPILNTDTENKNTLETDEPEIKENEAEILCVESKISNDMHIMSQSNDQTNKDPADSKKILPIVETLRHSEVIKALNEEYEQRRLREKKTEKMYTTFMQKPQGPVPNQKFDVQRVDGKKHYHIKIVKQPKPKVAPDYMPEESEIPPSSTSLNETELPQEVEPEVTEGEPKVSEADDYLLKEEISAANTEEERALEEEKAVEGEKAIEETEMKGESEENKLVEQLMESVKSMVDPNASLEQQLAQMQAQLAALAQLPYVIQQATDMVTNQITQMSQIQKQAEEEKALEATRVKKRHVPRVRVSRQPKPLFGPLPLEQRPLYLPGGRKWRWPRDAYDEQLIADTLQSQSELIQGKVMGSSNESAPPPIEERINFMKYEKPPVPLDHLEHSEVYKVVHNVNPAPVKRVELLTPVIAEADYRERCRSVTPIKERIEELEP